MKNVIYIILIFFSFELFAPKTVQAQGTLYVSNLGQTPVGIANIGSDSWIAQSLYTGTNAGGYALDSVQLLMVRRREIQPVSRFRFIVRFVQIYQISMSVILLVPPIQQQMVFLLMPLPTSRFYLFRFTML